MAKYQNIQDENQHISGTIEADSLVMNTSSTGYGWSVSEDGKGFVIWNDTGFNVLHDIETVEFQNGTLTLNSDGSTSFNANEEFEVGEKGEGNTTNDIVGETQYVRGTDDNDTFVIAGESGDYAWGATQDGQGIVIWSGDTFDIVYDVETVQFDDAKLVISEDGSYEIQNSTNPEAVAEPNNSSDTDGSDEKVSNPCSPCQPCSPCSPCSPCQPCNPCSPAKEAGSDSSETTTDGENVAPVAVHDTQETDNQTAVVLNPLANDSDANGDIFSITDFEQPPNGTVVLNDDGTLTYTPNEDFVGVDSFYYTITDANGDKGTAQICVDVSEAAPLETSSTENTPPVAVHDVDTTDNQTPVTLNPLANDSDPDGDDISITDFEQPPNGTVTQNEDGTLTYTPDAGFVGIDSFYYTITDEKGDKATAQICVTVEEPPNTDPVAEDDCDEPPTSGPITIDVLDNDTDADGDTLIVTSVTNGSNGTVVINPDGTVTYTPNDGFVGEDEFTYTISDGNGGTDTAKVCVEVQAPPNTPPVAEDDCDEPATSGPITIDVLDNDTDADGDTITVTSVTNGSNGTVVINPDGTVTYTPNDGFVGEDEFTYTISDGKGGTDIGKVCVEVQEPPNTPPVAEDDCDEPATSGPITIDVLDNDTDADGDTITVTSVTDGLNGKVVINPDGTVTYTPNPGFIGTDEFTYTISDGKGGEDTAKVCIEVVAPPNTNPVAEDDCDNDPTTGPITIDVLDNDKDADGDTLTVTSVTNGVNGTVSINADGTVSYTPNEGFIGKDEFTYTISDGKGGTDTAKVCIEVVEPPNKDPLASNDSATMKCVDSNIVIDPLVNDTDADKDALKVTSTTDGANGKVSINADGTITYTPNAGFHGTDTFEYTVSDGNGGTDTAQITVEVQEPKTINAQVTGSRSVNEGSTGSYQVQLDDTVSEDTWFTIRVNDGSANRVDRDDFAANNQDIIYNGYYTQFVSGRNLQFIHDRVPNGHAYEGGLNDRAAVGPDGKPVWDYTVLKDGVVQSGGVLKVLVKAGERTSESFNVKAFQEKVTVDVSDNPGGDSFRQEGNENLSISIAGADSHGCDKINTGSPMSVTIIDRDSTTVTPIAFDLNGDGKIGVTGETTSREKDEDAELGHTVNFDIDGDGDLDTTEWLDGLGDGLLVDNRDGNAATDMDGSRLFGDQGGTYENGYEKLRLLDENNDGKLTGSELFGLELWVDDGDAKVEAGELQTLADHDIVEISTGETIVTDEDGKPLIQSTATTSSGDSILTEDVWFGASDTTILDVEAERMDYNMEIRFLEAEFAMI